jgi:hypothetical protein
MDKVQKQDSSKCITPSSEPFRIDLRNLDLYRFSAAQDHVSYIYRNTHFILTQR